MPGTFLLDTTAAVAILQSDPAVAAVLTAAEHIVLPVTVVGELIYGAYNSGRPAENMAKVEALASANTVLDCDLDTARQYGRIRQQLRAKGKPIPENDIWIAAVALQHGLLVITRDAHFMEVDGLTVMGW
jgi:tRNA(fMet)-specific endonuclease VapC